MDADFSDAYFSNVEFRGFRLTKVALPQDSDVTRVGHFSCVAQWIVDHIEDDGSGPARQLRGVMANSLKGLGAASPPIHDVATVFNRRDWRAWGGDELLGLAERAVKRAETECNA
ncbi:MAG: hypothetical protein ACYDCS_09150 [Candidatus Dormibacteria bacterium]